MGTDIYLEWDDMTGQENEQQCTGFDITKGEAGYLRASIGMRKENAILRELFPEQYWELTEEQYKEGGLRYDFVRNIKRLRGILAPYVDSTEDKNQFEHITFRSTWASSVFDFFKLGERMQLQDRNPKVRISW